MSFETHVVLQGNEGVTEARSEDRGRNQILSKGVTNENGVSVISLVFLSAVLDLLGSFCSSECRQTELHVSCCRPSQTHSRSLFSQRQMGTDLQDWEQTDDIAPVALYETTSAFHTRPVQIVFHMLTCRYLWR